MFYMNDPNDIGEEFEDERAEYDTDTLQELELDRKLDLIYSFKNEIIKDPEFGAIENISSFELLFIFENTNKIKNKKYTLTVDQWYLFDNLFIDLYGVKKSLQFFNVIKHEIKKKLYI